MFSYIPGKVYSLTPRTGDELWEGSKKAESGQHGRLYIRPRHKVFKYITPRYVPVPLMSK